MNEKILKMAQRCAFFGVDLKIIRRIFNTYIQEMTIAETIEFGKEIGKYEAIHQVALNFIATTNEIDHQFFLSILGKRITEDFLIDESDLDFIKKTYDEKYFFYK